MTSTLTSEISKHASLSARDKMLVRNNTIFKTFKEGEIFIKRGDVPNIIGFVAEGVFRSYKMGEDDMEITTHFFQPKDFVLSYPGFTNFTPVKETIHAETKSTLIVIDRRQWNIFSEKISNWKYAFNLITNSFLIEKNSFQRDIINEDTKSIYLKFNRLFPELNKVVPLGHIASYLGMTQSTLSRVRKKIVSG